jgi:tRNA pseudouridine38-40 synthase
LPTYRLDIEYDGTDWKGWQIQPDHPTVQGAIEDALGIALRSRVSITGSGRTDSGVHASGQVAHFKFDDPFDPEKLFGSLNGILPRSIAVRSLTEAHDSFHARFDASSRQYRYRISVIPVALDAHIRWFVRPSPDFDMMNRAAEMLLGTHNFSAFCRVISETENRVCSLTEARWSPVPEREGSFDFVIRADRYLHGMVRAIVGTLIEVGHGKRSVDSIPKLIQSEDRTEAGFAAPAMGLTLERVSY